MKKAMIIRMAAMALMLALMIPATALASDLTDFVRDVNKRALSDLSKFKVSLQGQFNVPGGTVDVLLSNAKDPADAYMMLKVSELSGHTPDEVLKVYNANREKGWGYIAKQMGIKPGSKEFHELKGGASGKSKGNKGKGNKGKGRK